MPNPETGYSPLGDMIKRVQTRYNIRFLMNDSRVICRDPNRVDDILTTAQLGDAMLLGKAILSEPAKDGDVKYRTNLAKAVQHGFGVELFVHTDSDEYKRLDTVLETIPLEDPANLNEALRLIGIGGNYKEEPKKIMQKKEEPTLLELGIFAIYPPVEAFFLIKGNWEDHQNGTFTAIKNLKTLFVSQNTEVDFPEEDFTKWLTQYIALCPLVSRVYERKRPTGFLSKKDLIHFVFWRHSKLIRATGKMPRYTIRKTLTPEEELLLKNGNEGVLGSA